MVLATYTRLNSESAYSGKYLVGTNINSVTGTQLAAGSYGSITVPGLRKRHLLIWYHKFLALMAQQNTRSDGNGFLQCCNLLQNWL